MGKFLVQWSPLPSKAFQCRRSNERYPDPVPRKKFKSLIPAQKSELIQKLHIPPWQAQTWPKTKTTKILANSSKQPWLDLKVYLSSLNAKLWINYFLQIYCHICLMPAALCEDKCVSSVGGCYVLWGSCLRGFGLWTDGWTFYILGSKSLQVLSGSTSANCCSQGLAEK